MLACAGVATAQTYRTAGVTVRFGSEADASSAAQVLRVVAQAAAELDFRCSDPLVVIHPDLESYRDASGAPWFLLAAADPEACRVDTQRIAILNSHGGLRTTLRHELHHLAQAEGLPRWQAEGEAQRFAGERPAAEPLTNVGPREVDLYLADPPSQGLYLRALATAWHWTGDAAR